MRPHKRLRAPTKHLGQTMRHMHGGVPHPGCQGLQLKVLLIPLVLQQADHSLLNSRTHCLQILAWNQPTLKNSFGHNQQQIKSVRSCIVSRRVTPSAIEMQSACQAAYCGKDMHAGRHSLRNDMCICVLGEQKGSSDWPKSCFARLLCFHL